MDTLIIGGLLVIGVGALIALFFVLRGGTPQAKAPEAVPQTAREATPLSVDQPAPQPQSVQRTATTPLMEEVHETEARTVPVPIAAIPEQPVVTTAHQVYEREQPLKVRLNGQFHELTLGLRSLQQQATDMEQRLGSLNKMLETIEHDQSEEK